MSVSTGLNPDFTALSLLGLSCPSSGDQTRTNCCCSWFSSCCIPGIFWCHIRLCVCGGGEKNCCRRSQKPGIFLTLQKSWGCVCTAEPSQFLPLGVGHVCLPENPSVDGLFSLGKLLFPLQHLLGLLCRQSAASPAPGGTAPRSQRGETLGEGKEFSWGCSQGVLCSCGWGTPWSLFPEELSVCCASPSSWQPELFCSHTPCSAHN